MARPSSPSPPQRGAAARGGVRSAALSARLLATLMAALMAALLVPVEGAARQTEANPTAAPCGPVVVAELAWPSAGLAAHVLERVLRDGYRCAAVRRRADLSAVLAAGGVAPEDVAGAGLAPGATGARPGVVVAGAPRDRVTARPHVWRAGGPLFDGDVGPGLFAPTWVLAANPDIRTLADAFRRADAFRGADGARPKLHLCPTAWDCARDGRALAAGLNLDRRFDVIEHDSGTALIAALEEAAERHEPWLGYHARPSARATVPGLRRLPSGRILLCMDGAGAGLDGASGRGADRDGVDGDGDGEGDEARILLRVEGRNAQPGGATPGCRAPFERAPVVTALTAAFATRHPRSRALAARFTLPVDAVEEALLWRARRGATLAAAAERLLLTRPELWRRWVDAEAAKALGAALERAARDAPANE